MFYESSTAKPGSLVLGDIRRRDGVIYNKGSRIPLINRRNQYRQLFMKQLLFFLLLAIASNTHAEPKAFIDGYELLRLCETATQSDFSRATDCLGYVSGLSDTHETFAELKIVEKQWCWPSQGVSNREMVKVVYKYLQTNTALLDKSAALLSSIAFFEAYPCT